VHEPSVLLLDEPTVGLDPQQRAFLYALMSGLAGDGATVLTSTHNMDDVAATAHRILVLDGGRLVADETLAVGDSVERYALVNEVVARTLVDRR
jgi:ABC-type multidrug transport system ATPase subunit